eukprot:scaffold4380_cov146-Skeletonema_menzelii.AAC.9
MGPRFLYRPLPDDGTLFSSLLPLTWFVALVHSSVLSCYLSITNTSGKIGYRMPGGEIDAIIDIKLSMFYYRSIHRIGASGVVYGWMGMRLITSWVSLHHSRLNGIDYFFLTMAVAHDLSKSPLSLEDFNLSTFFEEDNVDHSVHLMGFVSGMVWAMLLITWEKISNFGFLNLWRWRGGRRRLGARWEEEQQRQHREQQRRQHSRLINVEEIADTRQRTSL